VSSGSTQTREGERGENGLPLTALDQLAREEPERATNRMACSDFARPGGFARYEKKK
jgi:hypothetical protein